MTSLVWKEPIPRQCREQRISFKGNIIIRGGAKNAYVAIRWQHRFMMPLHVAIRAVEPDFKKSNKKSDAQGACRRLYPTFA